MLAGCVRKKLRNKCSTNEEDALVKEDVVAAAGRQTEQLDGMRAITHANMHPCSLFGLSAAETSA